MLRRFESARIFSVWSSKRLFALSGPTERRPVGSPRGAAARSAGQGGDRDPTVSKARLAELAPLAAELVVRVVETDELAWR